MRYNAITLIDSNFDRIKHIFLNPKSFFKFSQHSPCIPLFIKEFLPCHDTTPNNDSSYLHPTKQKMNERKRIDESTPKRGEKTR